MFRDPGYLLGLVLAVAGLYILGMIGENRRKKISSLLGRPQTLARLTPPETEGLRKLRWALRLAGVSFIFIALAGPQWGVELAPMNAKSRHVVIAVDTSLSMLTEDVHPSRLEKAKDEMSLLLDELKGERVGIVAFAGEAALVCPVTSDLSAAKEILGSLAPGMIPSPGTAIGGAIRTANEALSKYPGTKALVILSDGEDHKTDPQGAAAEASSLGIQIFSIGVGTPEGGPIPIKDDSGQLSGYKKDRSGTTVISKLGESTLSEIASKTSGSYYRASPGANEVSEIVSRIGKLSPTESAGGGNARYKNHFLLPLWIAFVMLLAELCIPERRLASLFIMLLLSIGAVRPAGAAGSESTLRRGNKLYDEGKFEPALEQYAISGAKSPSDARPIFNGGDALYRMEQFDRASEAFTSVAESKAPAKVRADAYYNLGNSHFSAKDYKDAVAAYQKAVALNPKDPAFRHNLAVALRALKNPPPQQKKNQNQKDKQDPKDEKKNPQDKSGGKNPPQQPKTRPENKMSSEDAQRVMNAVDEREKALKKELGLKKQPPSKKPQPDEDW